MPENRIKKTDKVIVGSGEVGEKVIPFGYIF